MLSNHDVLQAIGANTIARLEILFGLSPGHAYGEIRQRCRRLENHKYIRFDYLDDESGYMLTPEGLREYERCRDNAGGKRNDDKE